MNYWKALKDFTIELSYEIFKTMFLYIGLFSIFILYLLMMVLLANVVVSSKIEVTNSIIRNLDPLDAFFIKTDFFVTESIEKETRITQQIFVELNKNSIKNIEVINVVLFDSNKKPLETSFKIKGKYICIKIPLLENGATYTLTTKCRGDIVNSPTPETPKDIVNLYTTKVTKIWGNHDQ